ncbi:MAG: cytidyltransferase [Chitinophagaceae bacterium]|nr:MAG: cytidyltransferase [Chitinophagaceae bacterium]
MEAQGKRKNKFGMRKGLIVGKFMPVHKGHLSLINFALQHCDTLTVLLCYHPKEPIPGTVRESWLRQLYLNDPKVCIASFEYDPAVLTETSEPEPSYAKAWSAQLKKLVPGVDVVFSSEAYGDLFASFMGAEHKLFDAPRSLVPVSASAIREKPFAYWSYLPGEVQPYYVKKIALIGSESTGKSTLAERLAQHYKTVYVPEMAREIIGHTNDCTKQDLLTIAKLQATTIFAKTKIANRVLFCDTELTVTKSYAAFLFQQELAVEEWIEKANQCDLYLFLDTNCPYVQDGTRLDEEEREALSRSHLLMVKKALLPYRNISGDWEERFAQACREIDHFIGHYS